MSRLSVAAINWNLIRQAGQEEVFDPLLETRNWEFVNNRSIKEAATLAFVITTFANRHLFFYLMQSYEAIKLLGRGGLGEVHLCHHKISRRKYVMKKFQNSDTIPKTKIHDEDTPLEIAYLKSLDHPYIVKYKTHFLLSGYWYLIMEYDESYQDLYSVSRKYCLTEEIITSIAKQLHQVLSFLLDSNIDHGDIKEENLLINIKTGRIKLIDFGSALPVRRPSEGSRTTMGCNFLKGTACCLPPEAFIKHRYLPLQTTVWSFGCLLYGCVTGKSPFLSMSQIVKKRVHLDEHHRQRISPNLCNIIERCLEPNRILRISWTEIGRNL